MGFTERFTRRFTPIAILLLFTITACSADSKPKNIIFFIGDGMGIGAISAARCAGPGENGKLMLDSMPIIGVAKTHSNNSLVTDSAASGTALATGCKTDNGRIATDASGKKLKTLAELASELGKSTGIITTDWLTGATPAAFFAHIDNRGKQDDIASQLPTTKVTVAMGAGKANFVPAVDGKGGRKDGLDIAAVCKANGIDVCYDYASMTESKADRLLALVNFDEKDMTLQNMLNTTLSKVSTDEDGFFIMAESCLPDKGGHGNDLPTVLKGVNSLDDTLKAALEFAKKDGNTLVVVTSDHDTGGLTVSETGEKGKRFAAGWTGGGHTGNMVLVYAFGPGSEKFTGTHDNTDLPKIMAGLWGKKLNE